MTQERLTGQVKWFDPKKGFGFIQGPQGQDVFVHYSQIGGSGFRSLRDGEDVTYELTEGEKGLQAREVLRDQADVQDGADAAASTREGDDRYGNSRHETTAPTTTATAPGAPADPGPRVGGYSNSYRGR